MMKFTLLRHLPPPPRVDHRRVFPKMEGDFGASSKRIAKGRFLNLPGDAGDFLTLDTLHHVESDANGSPFRGTLLGFRTGDVGTGLLEIMRDPF